jgi:hypothetical protein
MGSGLNACAAFCVNLLARHALVLFEGIGFACAGHIRSLRRHLVVFILKRVQRLFIIKSLVCH